MPLRDVVIRARLNEMVGDEMVEVWLQEAAAPWALESTVAVEGDDAQDFALSALASDVVHTLQLRGIRDGRYRAGYLGGDPDSWPAQSRLEFKPGQVPAGAPTIDSAVWAGALLDPGETTVMVTPHAAHHDLDLQLLRDGVVVATVAAPHSGASVEMTDVAPPIDEDHDYTARHISYGLGGAADGPETVFTGVALPVVDGIVENTVDNRLEVSISVRGEYDHLKLFTRWPVGSLDYEGGTEYDLDEVAIVDSPILLDGSELTPPYSIGTPGADEVHDIEFQLRAYTAGDVLIRAGAWAAGSFQIPGP